jgi:hypothetical protein
MMKYLFPLISFVLLSGPVYAAERLNMEGTKIRGNQELPKVLYIVPWHEAEVPDLSQPPLQSLIDEALAPVDREVFQRKIRYYDALSVQKARGNAN